MAGWRSVLEQSAIARFASRMLATSGRLVRKPHEQRGLRAGYFNFVPGLASPAAADATGLASPAAADATGDAGLDDEERMDRAFDNNHY